MSSLLVIEMSSANVSENSTANEYGRQEEASVTFSVIFIGPGHAENL